MDTLGTMLAFPLLAATTASMSAMHLWSLLWRGAGGHDPRGKETGRGTINIGDGGGKRAAHSSSCGRNARLESRQDRVRKAAAGRSRTSCGVLTPPQRLAGQVSPRVGDGNSQCWRHGVGGQRSQVDMIHPTETRAYIRLRVF